MKKTFETFDFFLLLLFEINLNKMKKTLLLSLILLVFFSCTSKEKTTKEATITVSILPQKFFVDYLTNSSIAVNVMIPPGASPASYDPSPKQLKALSNSVVYFRIGHIEFEKTWIKKIKTQNPQLKFVNTSEKANLIYASEHRHGDHVHKSGIDPHIWLSPREVTTQIDIVYKELCTIFPENKVQFENNYHKLIDSINTRDSLFNFLFSNCNSKKFIIFHPALAYFARDYGLIQIPMEVDGKEPNPNELKKIIDVAIKENIKAVFIQEEFDVENAHSIAKEIDGKVIQLNPLAYNWLESVSEIAESLHKALCKKND